MAFEIVHKIQPNKILYVAETKVSVWQMFYEAENTIADNKTEFITIATRRGFKCRKSA